MKALLKNLDGTEREVTEKFFGDVYIVPDRGEPYPLVRTAATIWDRPIMRQRIYKREGYEQQGNYGRLVFREVPGGKRYRQYRDSEGHLQMETLPPEDDS